MLTGFNKKILLLFIILTTGVILAGIATYKTQQNVKDTEAWVTRTDKVITETKEVITSLKDIVLAARGFVITGNSLFIKPLHTTKTKLYTHLQNLNNLTADNSTQTAKIDSLKKLIIIRSNFSDSVIQLRKEKGFAIAKKKFSTINGEHYLEEILQLHNEIITTENDLLTTRKLANTKSYQYFILSFYLLLAGILLLLTIAVFIVWQNNLIRNKIETQLMEYKSFFNNNNDLCIVANNNGYFETVNQQLETTLGYTQKEITATPFITFLHSDDVAASMERYKNYQVAHKNKPTTINRYRKKDGSYVWIEWRSIPNTITGKIYAIGRNITERKQIDEILQNTLKDLANYKYALNESSIIAITDANGNMQHVNDNFCTISKFNREELIGQNMRIVNSGYHNKEFFSHLWHTILKGEIWKGEIRDYTKDKSIFWVYTVIVPLQDDTHTTQQYIAIMTDFTARKEAEFQLDYLNKELQSFSYSVSHDLRAPLRGIMGFTSILEEEYAAKLDDEAKRITHVIKNNATRMGILIDDLLAFSRLGRQPVSKRIFSTNTLVKEIIEEQTRENTHNSIEWQIQTLPPSFGDISLMRQVWINLISNAIKYSGNNNHPTIEIGSFRQNNKWVFFIRDNGVGFDEKYKEKLFKVFQRLHASNEFEGTGIGLAIVAKIITNHGGEVWAEGAINKGATFYFTIPDNQN